MSLKITPAEAHEILRTAAEICPAEVINAAVARVATEINATLRDAHPLLLCVMRGALVFAGQLLPQLDFPLEVDVVDATRYGDAIQGGELVFRTMPATAVEGRTVLLVDDILDEGITLTLLRDRLLASGALRVLTAVFAVKQRPRSKPLAADYSGVMLPDRYVFGFGLDVHGYWRNLPAVYALND